MKQTYTNYYKNGTIRSVGKLTDGKRDGYWKWYRADGTKLKTGYFSEGELTKQWMNYNKKESLLDPYPQVKKDHR